MRLPQYAVDDGVSQIDVGRSHVDLRAEALFSVAERAGAHRAEQGEVLLPAPVPPGALFPRLRQRAARRGNLFRRVIADVSLSHFDELFGIPVNFLEKVGSVYLLRIGKSQPGDILPDRVHIFRLFLGRIGIVEEEIALPAVFFADAEIDAHALRMPDVKVSVRLGGETRLHRRHFARRKFLLYDLFDKIIRHDVLRTRRAPALRLSFYFLSYFIILSHILPLHK